VSGVIGREGRTVCLRALIEFIAWQVKQFLAGLDRDE
jgi:predicted RNA-binding protein YlqC (UPF0109 family)